VQLGTVLLMKQNGNNSVHCHICILRQWVGFIHSSCQFQLRFLRAFFVRMLFLQLFMYIRRKKAAKTTYIQKKCAKNVDEIDTWGRFQKCFTSSFYTHRSQKCKKTLTTWQSFCTFGICACKNWLVNMLVKSTPKFGKRVSDTHQFFYSDLSEMKTMKTNRWIELIKNFF